jgi:hypothetical protein
MFDWQSNLNNVLESIEVQKKKKGKMRQNYGFVVAVPHPALQFSIARKTKQKEKNSEF